MKTLIRRVADLGLHCLSKSRKKDARLIWINMFSVFFCFFFSQGRITCTVCMFMNHSRTQGNDCTCEKLGYRPPINLLRTVPRRCSIVVYSNCHCSSTFCMLLTCSCCLVEPADHLLRKCCPLDFPVVCVCGGGGCCFFFCCCFFCLFVFCFSFVFLLLLFTQT